MIEVAIRTQLRDYRLDIELSVPGSITVLFGRSGAGKSMTLACVAGLVTPDDGTIRVNDRLYFDRQGGINLPPQQRRAGYVTQDYLLFPHLSVWDNVSFGLASQTKDEKAAIVQEALVWLGLEQLARRRPRELSGGQQQRVALARALVLRPDILLLDEPFSALDHPTRARLRRDVLALQRELKIPALFVTHDLAEALALADTMAVVVDGRVHQIDTPDNVCRRPASDLVAELVDPQHAVKPHSR